MPSRLSVAILISLPLAAASCVAAGAPPRPVDEYQVKAAFLYNFAKFIDWPPGAFRDATDPLVICVLGQDPFGRVLDDVVAGRKIDGHGLVVRRISAPRYASGCRILFVSPSEPKRSLAILAELNETGMLTIGESDSATSEGMVINFLLENGKVRFEIDMEAAEREKLRVSSRLLSLASPSKKTAIGSVR